MFPRRWAGNLGRYDVYRCLRAEWIFPAATPEQMYYSLTQKLMALPDDTILFPATTTRAYRTRLSASKRRLIPTCRFIFPEAVLSGDGLSLIAAD